MKSRFRIVTLMLVLVAAQFAFGTPLDDYIKAPDANYRYSLVNTIKTTKGYTVFVLNMTSQSWRSRAEVNRTLWRHWLIIYKPDNVTSNKALLWITGGSNKDPVPPKINFDLLMTAFDARTIVAELRVVPNQPLIFPDGGGPRNEDAIIAYTFDKYMSTDDSTWPLLLPMVKSAVRAMDTIHSHMLSVSKGKLDITEFVVSGVSKRGWTIWLTAAVDKRVIAIVPLVIDLLNMDKQMKHHFSAYGFYSDAVEDYTKMNIFDRLDTHKGQTLRKFIDPYEYRSRYTMPKYLINSSGDQFFLPDSAQFYFDDLPGPKYLRYIPNTDHNLSHGPPPQRSDEFKSLEVFYKSIVEDKLLPKFSWKVRDDGAIEVNTRTTPKAVKLWQVTNKRARDFRLNSIYTGPFSWKSSPLPARSAGIYIAKVPEPEKGWTAFFVELTFDSGSQFPYKFTTQVHVVPQTLPFADKLKKVSKSAEDLAGKPLDEKVLYAELTPQEFRERIAAVPIAYLPLGVEESC